MSASRWGAAHFIIFLALLLCILAVVFSSIAPVILAAALLLVGCGFWLLLRL